MSISEVPFETVPEDEAEDAIAIGIMQAKVHELMIAKDKQDSVKDLFGKPAAAPRAQHRKNHGALWAEFKVEVNSALPEDARAGLFAQAGTYKAVIRFSNGKEVDDTKNDAHGMAVKVLVPADKSPTGKAQSQDFIMIDHPVFLAKNAKHFRGLFQMQAAAGKLGAELAATLQAKELEKAESIKAELGKIRATIAEQYPISKDMLKQAGLSPLHMRYWSQSPYRLGSKYAMKFFVAPAKSSVSEHYLREAMVSLLTSNKSTWTFDFYVQLFVNQTDTPIEDPTVEWKSEAVKVATLSIAPQDFHTEEQMEFCENLTYNPWQGLPEHAPLGGINRVRQKVYAASSALRHSKNEVPESEPL